MTTQQPNTIPIRYEGRDRELLLLADDVYLIDDGGGFILEPSKALRLLRKTAGGSPIERAFAAAWFMRFGDFPRSQVSIQRHDGRFFRADFLLGADLVVELDGHDWHASKPQRERDAKRDRELMRLGFRVIRFTGSEVSNNPDVCVLEAAALAGVQ